MTKEVEKKVALLTCQAAEMIVAAKHKALRISQVKSFMDALEKFNNRDLKYLPPAKNICPHCLNRLENDFCPVCRYRSY